MPKELKSCRELDRLASVEVKASDANEFRGYTKDRVYNSGSWLDRSVVSGGPAPSQAK